MHHLRRILSLASITLLLGACAITTSISQGTLEEGIYSSSTGEFSLSVPEETVVRDGRQPLGGYLTLSNLQPPLRKQGLAYYRVAAPADGMSPEEEKGIVKSGHDDWLKNYALLDTNRIIHEEWTEHNGKPSYFTVIEDHSPGFLVKPGGYYGVYGFIAGNYSYVLYELIDAPYQLKGAEDSPERLAIKDPANRLTAVLQFVATARFHEARENRFPLAE